MRIETDGNHFEQMRSLQQDLTFSQAAPFFLDHKSDLRFEKMKNLHLIGEDGLYTNLGLLLSDQNPFTVKLA